MTASTAVPGSLRVPLLDHGPAMAIAAAEYDRFLGALSGLAPADWTRPTVCSGWDVRAMAGHVLGMARMVSSLPQFVRQNVAAARAGGGIDALTAIQVRQQASLSAAQLVERFAIVAPRAARGRHRLSRVLGRLPLPEAQAVGEDRERWAFGYLFDVILTRDTWMHRMDIGRATGSAPVLSADHDGLLVHDVVAEWSQRHGQPFRLRLTGPAGGTWSAGRCGPDIELDAVEFCRVLSGRGSDTGLLAQQVPF